MTDFVPESDPALLAAEQFARYSVRLAVFEGPLDLLLHLIRINEVEITDIPIARIGEQYLEYLTLMGELDLELVGEYLVMASTLAWIKSRMLLPAERVGEEDSPYGMTLGITYPKVDIDAPNTNFAQKKDVVMLGGPRLMSVRRADGSRDLRNEKGTWHRTGLDDPEIDKPVFRGVEDEHAIGDAQNPRDRQMLAWPGRALHHRKRPGVCAPGRRRDGR